LIGVFDIAGSVLKGCACIGLDDDDDDVRHVPEDLMSYDVLNFAYRNQ